MHEGSRPPFRILYEQPAIEEGRRRRRGKNGVVVSDVYPRQERRFRITFEPIAQTSRGPCLKRLGQLHIMKGEDCTEAQGHIYTVSM